MTFLNRGVFDYGDHWRFYGACLWSHVDEEFVGLQLARWLVCFEAIEATSHTRDATHVFFFFFVCDCLFASVPQTSVVRVPTTR